MMPKGRNRRNLRDKEGREKRNYYAMIFNLRGPLKDACEAIVADEEFDRAAEKYATAWREKLRAHLGEDSVRCRQHVMAHSLAGLLRTGLGDDGRFPLALALSLAMTDRVQQCVEKSDRSERGELGRN
jgi:hypothetical protein